MTLQQQVSAHAGVELCRNLRGDDLLGGFIIPAVVFELAPESNPYQNMRAIRRHRGHRGDAAEKKDPVGARIGDTVKLFERRPGAGKGQSPEPRCQIAVELSLNPIRNFLQTHGSEFGKHAAGFQGEGDLAGFRREQAPRIDANARLQRFPALRAGGIARRISAVPPDEEEIGIGGPARLLQAVAGFHCIEQRIEQAIHLPGLLH
jgi:hypothetical protein